MSREGVPVNARLHCRGHAPPPPSLGLLLNTVTMDNAAYDAHEDASLGRGRSDGVLSTTVELGELSVSLPPAAAPGRTARAAPSNGSAPLCKPDVCRSMMAPQVMVKKPTALRPNPWHRYKTILLVATVVGLIIWAVAYLVLGYLGIL